MKPTFFKGKWKGAKRLSWNGRRGFAPTVRRHGCSLGDMCAKEGDGREASTVFLVRSCADAMPNSMFEWNCTAPQSSTNTAW